MAFLVGQRQIDLKTFPITIFFSLLLCKLVASDLTMISSCVSNYTETVNNRTGLVDYKTNVQSLFYDLTANGFSNYLSFYNTTAGKPPYKSYGMYLCRGDATLEICSSCFNNLTDWVVSSDLDANCTELVAFSDHCTLRYANYSFFGKANNADLGYTAGKFTKTISQAYNSTLEGAVERVTREAAYNSTNLFATTEAAVDEHEKVYALAQCMPDITRGDCNECLKAAYAHLHLNTTDGFIKDAWTFLPSCQLRYDNASFFRVSAATTNPAPLVSAAFLVISLSLILF